MFEVQALQSDGKSWLAIFPDRRFTTYAAAYDCMIGRGGYKRHTVKYRIVKV